MKSRPWIVKAITLSLFAVPVVAVMIICFAKKSGQTMNIGASIIADVWLLSIASIVVAFGIWKVRPWGFFMMMALGIIVVGADIHQVLTNPKTLNVWDYIDVALVATAFGFLTRKHVREPYFNPKIRWWERPARHQVSLHGKFAFNGQSTESPILDISTGGCFVNIETDVLDGEVIEVAVDYNNIKFHSPAKVVRHSHDPKGIGLMFVDTPRENQKEIKRLMKDLRRQATI